MKVKILILVLLAGNIFALNYTHEAVEWGATGLVGLGVYSLWRCGPFFEKPLFGGETDAPFVDETVPNGWLVISNAGIGAAIFAIPTEMGMEDKYGYAKGFVQTQVLNSFLVLIVKDVTGRYRPNADAKSLAGYKERDFRDSFPSGHTATCFATATYFSMYVWTAFGENDSNGEIIGKTVLTAALYGLASWVGYTRVQDNAHRTDDVIAGAALGSAAAAGIFVFQHNRGRAALELNPVEGGISLTWRF